MSMYKLVDRKEDMKDILEESRCEGCGVYPSQTHKPNCPWLKQSIKRQHEKEKIRDMIEKYIDIDGLVDEIYKV